jgi:glucose/arabinose dehydrogenase
MKATFFATMSAAVVATAIGLYAQQRQPAPACDPGNGGITLPEGFCALVAADNLGAARHVAVNANGDVYVALQGNRQGVGAGVVGLRDTDGDGKMDVTEKFGDKSTTGLAIRNGYIYAATVSSVERFKLAPGELKPGPAEVVVADLPVTTPHQDKGLALDGRGGLYVSIGAPSNTCQPQDRRPRLAGQDPCPMLANSGGVWKFDENRLGQKQTDGTLYSTGLRQMPALTWHDGALYTVMNSRDQIDTLWPDKFQGEDNNTRPAEPMYRLEEGGNYGWPYCYEDLKAKALILNPEYGGDGTTVGRCSEFKRAIATFPPHWAPVAVTFYSGTQFPQKYRGGAFIAFHGSWNRPPEQQGYNVTFQPFVNGRPSGEFEVFASGFTGAATVRNAQQATYRPDGVMQGPDGSLYISESNKGRLWRVFFKGAGAQ